MFELNNLDLIVPLPVEDYFIYINDFLIFKKDEVEKITRYFLEALGDDYATCCKSKSFFPLQRCINRSSEPNCKSFKRNFSGVEVANKLGQQKKCRYKLKLENDVIILEPILGKRVFQE